jgi:hypothetical protein
VVLSLSLGKKEKDELEKQLSKSTEEFQTALVQQEQLVEKIDSGSSFRGQCSLLLTVLYLFVPLLLLQ